MAKTVFHIQNDLTFAGKGTLIEAENIIGKVSFAQGISKAIGLFQNIDREYKKAVGNDCIIDDDEREDLKAGMQRVLYYTFFLRTQVEKLLIHE